MGLDLRIFAVNMSEMVEIGTHFESKRIGILPLPGFALMSYAATVEPFRAANLLANQLLYEIVNITTQGKSIPSSGAASVQAQAQIEDQTKLDMLLVIAGGRPGEYSNARVLHWIARMSRTGILIGGVSGGPVILARAGVMTGRRMTVHWEHADALAEISPNLAIERTLFVFDRDRVTCAGGTAPMDMAHALIAQDHGNKFAHLVSDWFMHTDIRPAGGQQRGGLVERVGTTNAAILDAVEAMESHVADLLTLHQLALISDVSARQLNRLFANKLGQPAMGYYRALRLEKAMNLLNNSPMPLTEIALATGFANSSHFSTAFRKHFGQKPSAIRS